MRIHIWPALVCGWVLGAMAGQTAFAQRPSGELFGAVSQADAIDESDADDDASEDGGMPGGRNPFQPVQYDPNVYGGYGQGVAPVGPGYYGGGMPPANVWPEMSPYTQHRRTETYNDGGLWSYNNDDNFANTYFFSSEYLYGHGQKPGFHQIGDPNLASTVFIVGDNQGPFAVFPSQGTGIFDRVFHEGVRLRYGYWSPEGSGMVISGFILAENNVNDGRYIQIGSPGNPLPIAGIIVNNNGAGVVLPFDERFYQRYSQEILGADAEYYQSSFLTRSFFNLKVAGGVKYLRVNETFFVQGDDTGEGYTAVQGGATSGTGTGGTGGTTGTTGFPNLPSITTPITHLGPAYTTIINSSTTNNLVGPTLGLRYELGGNLLKFWGVSKFGLMADIEEITVSSANVNQFKTGLDFLTSPNVIQASPSPNPQLIPTRVTKTTTHLAPLVDASINVEVPIFSMIPIINGWTLLKDAKFRVGYQYVWVGEIARAPAVINYNLHVPTIRTDSRTSFGYDVINFAVDWKW
jgi:hypothetical protein